MIKTRLSRPTDSLPSRILPRPILKRSHPSFWRRKKRQVALLCTEGDPAHCIRQNVIAQTLLNRAIKVTHILHNGNLTEAWHESSSPKQAELF